MSHSQDTAECQDPRILLYDDPDEQLTLMIITYQLAVVTLLRYIFKELANSNLTKVELITTINAQSDDVDSIILDSVSREKDESVNVEILGNRTIYHWNMTSEGWLSCYDKLNPFLVNQNPGHQYLTDAYTDDVTITFSFRQPGI